MRFFLFSLLLALSPSLAAQNPAPDLLGGARFFPLAIGNEWQFTERTYQYFFGGS